MPVPSGLLVNMKEFEEGIRTFIQRIPSIYEASNVTDSCLGTAINSAFKIAVMTCIKLTTFIMHISGSNWWQNFCDDM